MNKPVFGPKLLYLPHDSRWAVIQTIKQGKGENECTAAALKAASTFAMKHGVSQLPPSAVEAIQKKIRSRFLVVSPTVN